MQKVSTNINLELSLKEKAKKLYAELGMDLTTAITIFLKQSLRENGLPFKPSLDVPNESTIKAINEIKAMYDNPQTLKAYDSLEDALKDN